MLIACKNSTVTYTAHADMGTASPVSYTWEVFGDVSHSATGNHVTVNWSGDEWGMVVVTVVGSEGDTCTYGNRVKLIDIPTAGCTTIPAYTVLPNGSKVVRVCNGNSVQFIDQSSAGNSDIAGYHWGTSFLADPSATPGYLVENITANDIVTHRVYNNCGCYDEEEIAIEVISGDNLELKCYGTVCENAIVTYQATSPTCNNYTWYVEGGTLIDGQGTDSPTVQWDHPTNGYGVIGLDGALCGNQACPAMMSRKISIIQGHLTIEGQTDVCQGEAVLYTLPLMGSTGYDWEITPSTGVDLTMRNNSNELRLVFNAAGTYQLTCTYRCDFLDCGPYGAEPLTITVKPKLEIECDRRICVANACDLHTTPAVAATWKAYSLGNGNQLVATGTGTGFTHTFSPAGRYLITAEHASYCGPATFLLEVCAPPPAPTAADLDPANRHTACPWSGITLAGTPSEPEYSLVWAPACTTAAPQQHSGDNVTVSYQAEVCDVYVYNYDRVLQCASTDYYIHEVDVLTPAPLNIPPNITVCPNSIITWGDNEIPDQRNEGMLYEWTIQDNKQYCASVQGSHLSNGVTLAVNDIPTPTTFYVKLTRTFCGNFFVDTLIYITVTDAIQNTVSITGPNSVCVNSSATFSASGGTGSYRWDIDGGGYTGSSASHIFMHEGYRDVTLYENPYTYCTDANHLNRATTTIFVNPLPMVQDLAYDGNAGTVCIEPTLDPNSYSFSWTYRATAQTPELTLPSTAACTPYSQAGVYSCTVTNLSTGCSKTASKTFPQVACNPLSFTSSYDVCTSTLSITANQYPSIVNWKVTGGGYDIVKSGTNNRHAEITFHNIGVYTITATSGVMNCLRGEFVQTVDFIPDLTFEAKCNRIIVSNGSKYALPSQNIYITVTDCNNNSTAVTIPSTTSSYTFTPAAAPSSPCTYTFVLNGYGAANNITPACTLGEATIGPQNYYLSIGTSNPYSSTNTCDNTPIQLIATPSDPDVTIVSSNWDFDDNSTYKATGNSVYHTFGGSLSPYNVSVTTIDNNGCSKTTTTPLAITSFANPILGNVLLTPGSEPCPVVDTRDIVFSNGSPNNHYWWWSHKNPTHIAGGNPYTVSVPDDYYVYVENTNYCKKESSTFVKFKNAPTAAIYADHYSCCVGEEITLYGEQGPSNDPLTYSWTVTGVGTFTTPNITFTVPSIPGVYTVTLTVTNSQSTCSSTATETLTVRTPSTMPTLSFVGSPCIDDAPVQLAATGYTGEVHWSNGASGPTAYYYTHGLASTYYFDPAIGCSSESGEIRIDKQPDFDALLTGCCLKCKFIPSPLPVYGLTDENQTVAWKWKRDGNSIATGSGDYHVNPLMLPVPNFGTYTLDVDYGGSACHKTSPELTISKKDLCDCDSIQISYTLDTLLENCQLRYKARVTICNYSKIKTFCPQRLNQLYPLDNIHLVSTTFPPSAIPPGDCDVFEITIEVLNLEPTVASFILSDPECAECEIAFSIDLIPAAPDCEEDMKPVTFSVRTDLSSEVAAYFDFEFDVYSCQSLLGFWSEPPMIIDYQYNSGFVQGLGMLDMATLLQLLAENGEVCFHAITCENNQLCKHTYCFTAADIIDMLDDAGIQFRQGWVLSYGNANTLEPQNISIRLVPNPTTGETTVVGTIDEIVEVRVMDMHGRDIATYHDTGTFDVGSLAAGVYIVRVKTRTGDAKERVDYLKLVKK